MAEVLWEDAPNDPAKVDAWGCDKHVHVVVAVPHNRLGFNVVMSRREAASFAGKVIEAIEDAEDEVRYDTSELYIA
jgi:hypothetical protein